MSHSADWPDVLAELGYVRRTGDTVEVEDAGRLLSRIYSESDLLVTECIAPVCGRGSRTVISPQVVSAMAYESRRDGTSDVDSVPGNPRLREALTETVQVWQRLNRTNSATVFRRHANPIQGSRWRYRSSGGSLTDSLAAHWPVNCCRLVISYDGIVG